MNLNSNFGLPLFHRIGFDFVGIDPRGLIATATRITLRSESLKVLFNPFGNCP